MPVQIPVFPPGSLRRLPVHNTPSRMHSAACTDCSFHATSKNICLRPEGTPGGLLIIGDYPTATDEQYGRPMIGPAGTWMRGFISKYWQGPWAITNALGCIPDPSVKTPDVNITACRKYVVKALEDAQPELIMLMGSWAGESFFGEKFKPLSSRGGYGWWENPATGKLVPVVMLPSPAQAVKNTLIMRVFEEDFASAVDRYKNSQFQQPDQTLCVDLVDHTNVNNVFGDLCYADYVAFDTETSGLMYDSTFRVESIVMWAVKDGLPKKGYLWDREQIEDAALRQPLNRLLGSNVVPKVGFNTKYDIQAVFCDPLLGEFRGFLSDARLKRKLLAADADGSLDACAHMVGIVGHKTEAEEVVSVICAELNKLAKYRASNAVVGAPPAKPPTLKIINPADVPTSTTDALLAGHEPEKFAYRYIPRSIRRRYNALDVLATILVEEWADKQIGTGQFRPVWDEIIRPATVAMVEMERTGISVDQAKMQAFSDLLAVKIDTELKKLHAISPGINPASPMQVSAAIEKLALKLKMKTSTGKMSTSEASLQQYKGKHIFIDALLEFRRLSKLKSTYADGYQIYIRNGKIHTSYLLSGTETGRPSSSNPNMSVLPRCVDAEGNTEGQLLRDCFVASPDHFLMEVDRKQIEIYIAAWLSKDPAMMEILMRPGADFHMDAAKLASQVAWGITPDKVTKDHRQSMKTSVFAVLYELPESLGRLLAKRLSCTVAEGDKLAAALFGNFPRLKQWMQEQLAFARANGYMQTEWRGKPARRRMLWGIGNVSFDGQGERENAERSSWNGPVQGGAADYTTADLLPVLKELRMAGLRCYPILTIYDSIIFEVHKEDMHEAADIVRQVMSNHDLQPLKLAVDIKYGPTLGTMQELKEPV